MKTKFLLADDERDVEDLFRQQFRRQIQPNTYAFVFVRDGREALTVHLTQVTDTAHLTIQDTDIGISAGKLPPIFNRFSRAGDAAFRPGHERTGTGLTLVHTLTRKTFYRKVQSLVQLSPVDLIRQYRLRKSIDLLKAGRTASETAYMLGFESPSYFARVFREFYHQSPTEYLKK